MSRAYGIACRRRSSLLADANSRLRYLSFAGTEANHPTGQCSLPLTHTQHLTCYMKPHNHNHNFVHLEPTSQASKQPIAPSSECLQRLKLLRALAAPFSLISHGIFLPVGACVPCTRVYGTPHHIMIASRLGNDKLLNKLYVHRQEPARLPGSGTWIEVDWHLHSVAAAATAAAGTRIRQKKSLSLLDKNGYAGGA